ncbi:hypothetical protein VTN31DRAFT_5454 [Thermomyces dupontii]|uniref:uncharacterized protein n=1 Tax=Talaromyces thermophilus TaxID=28565 RepID=UPI0037434F14
MASLTEEERRVIENHPLNNTLDTLQEALRELDNSYSSDTDRKPEQLNDLLSDLFHILSKTKVASSLPSRISSRNLRQELAAVYWRIQDGDLSYNGYRPLVKLVIQKAADVDIWSAVFDLIAKGSRVTPLPTSAQNVVDNTPVKASSGSLQGSEQTRDQVGLRVFQEIQDCTYRNVQGFYEKYFENTNWADRAQKVYESTGHLHVDGEWVNIGDSPSQDDVLKLLFKLQDDFLSNESRRYYTIKLPRELVGGEPRRQIDVILKRKKGDPSNNEHDWKDIR